MHCVLTAKTVGNDQPNAITVSEPHGQPYIYLVNSDLVKYVLVNLAAMVWRSLMRGWSYEVSTFNRTVQIVEQ